LHHQAKNFRVGFAQVYFARGNAAVKQREKVPLADFVNHVLRNVGKVIQPVARQLQLAHRFYRALVGVQDALPFINDSLHLKGTAALSSVFQHQAVSSAAADDPAVQLFPFFAAKGQIKHFILGALVQKMIHQKIPRLKIHHNAAQIKNNVFIHKRFIPPVLAYIIPA